MLGQYVSNLERNQLNIGIWAGDVVLRNLRLKKEALEKFQLPIEVLDGYLGELTLTIPWKNLKNSPVKVVIKDVLLLAGPSDDSLYVHEPEKERKRLQDIKREQLENAELVNGQNFDTVVSGDEHKQATFTEQLVTKIVDNLQIYVQNIHIRFNDQKAHPGHDFSFGIQVDELRAVSTDENWVESFITAASSSVHKSIRLGSLSVYWNTDVRKMQQASSNNASIDDLKALFDNISKRDHIVRPVTVDAKVTVNKNRDATQAKYDIGLSCSELLLELDENQFTDMNYIVSYFSALLRSREYRQYHPATGLTPKNNPRDFWNFALSAVHDKVHDKRYKSSWEYIRKRRDMRIEYKDLWIQRHITPILTADEQRRLDLLEEELSFADIRFFRSLADAEYREKHPLKVSLKKAQSSWTNWLWGAKDTDVMDKSTPEQDEFIKSAIEWDESILNSRDAPDSVLIKCHLQLDSSSLHILRRRGENNEQSLQLLLSTLSGELITRPSSQKFSISLSDLECIDKFTFGSIYPVIVRAQSNDEKNTAVPFFETELEIAPLDGESDYAFSLKMRHAELVIIPSLLSDLSDFFAPKCADPAVKALRIAAAEKMSKGLREMSKAGLQFALESHRSVDVHINIDAPIIIIPEEYV